MFIEITDQYTKDKILINTTMINYIELNPGSDGNCRITFSSGKAFRINKSDRERILRVIK